MKRQKPTPPAPHAVRRPLLTLALGALLPATLLTACSTESDRATGPRAAADSTANGREVASIAPRALLAHEGGLTLLDTVTGTVLDETEIDGFLRLSSAGDGRHVVVVDSDTFRVYDTGVASERHGDHWHHRVSAARLTGTTYDSPSAGHVVPHDGWTALFSDGTGEFRLIETDAVADPGAKATTHVTGAAHHGVAARLSDGSLLHTEGTEEGRHSVVVRDDDSEIVRTDACPGVHGEAFAAPTVRGDVAVLGCEDGPVVLRDGAFHKVEVDGDYVRNGNLAGHPTSPVVLADHKVDANAELERPTSVGLVDTRTATMRTVELGSSYWFRSLARGGDGEALVLTYDGSLRVLDPETGVESARVPVIAPWREKSEWQQPGPVLQASGNQAYVTDAERGELVVVDLTTAKVVARHDVPQGVTEMAVTTGRPTAAAGETVEHSGAPDHGHDRTDHDHDHDH